MKKSLNTGMGTTSVRKNASLVKILFSVFFLAVSSFFVATLTAPHTQAAGETYYWDGTSIKATGGVLVNEVTFQLSGSDYVPTAPFEVNYRLNRTCTAQPDVAKIQATASNASGKLVTAGNFICAPLGTSGASNDDIAKVLPSIDIAISSTAPTPNPGSPTVPTSAPTAECDSGGGIFGPVMCGLLDGASAAIDTLVNNVLQPLLEVNFFTINPDPATNPIFLVWQNIRNAANVLFIVAFFAVIISQATSIGISSYGIKKMLPKIIAAAIMINLSYWICAAATDLFNVLGAGAYMLVKSATAGITLDFNTSGSQEVLGVGLAVVGLSALIGLSGGFAAAAWAIVPIIITAAVAMLVVVISLVARIIAIALLITIAPLAIAAFIFPGTESWFEKWRKAFVSLLLVYPMIMLLLGFGTVAAAVVSGLPNPNNNEALGLLWIVLAVFAQIAPLIAIPAVIKASSGVLQRFGVFTDNKGKGLADRGKNWAKNGKDAAKNARDARSLNPIVDPAGAGKIRQNWNRARRANPSRALIQRGARQDAVRSGAKAEFERAKAAYVGGELANNKKFQQRVAQVGRTGIYAAGSNAATDAVGRAYGQGQAVIAKLDAENLKNSMDELARTIIRSGGADGYADVGKALAEIARGGSVSVGGKALVGGSSMQQAALERLAGGGFNEDLRTLRDEAQDYNTGAVLDQEKFKSLNQAIDNNRSSVALDLAKGSDAFNNVNGEQLLGFDKSTAAAHIRHLEKLQSTGSADYGSAIAAFNGAVDTASRSNNKGSFRGQAGQTYLAGSTNMTVHANITSVASGRMDASTGQFR